MDVVRERFQGRDIDNLRLVRQPMFKSLPNEAIDGTEERLPGSCRIQSAPRSTHCAQRQSRATRSVCAGVGAAKLWSNHSRTAGWKNVIFVGELPLSDRVIDPLR